MAGSGYGPRGRARVGCTGSASRGSPSCLNVARHAAGASTRAAALTRAAGADPDPVLTLDEVNAVVQGGLPAAARRNPAWWGNEPGPRAGHVRAWLAAGLRVAEADLAAGKIRWQRVSS